MKSFKFGNAVVYINRVITFNHGRETTAEALISIRGDVQDFYLRNEIIDLAAHGLGQNLFCNEPRNRRVKGHEPVNGNKAFEIKWTIRTQRDYMKGGQAL